jgi:4-aminobutyrate aminotransferase
MQRRAAAAPRGIHHVTPVFIAKGEGALIEDVDGNQFIDFAGGIGCLNVGHRASQVTSAVRHQLDRFLHACFQVTPYEAYIRLAERLNELAPGTFPKKTLLVNSGAEAVENAAKIARAYTHRPAIICFEDAFHGRTLLTMSLTSKTNPYKAGFGPFVSDIYRIPYAYCYRCSYSLRYPSCELFCAHHLEDTFKRVVAADTVAAVIVEPIMGEGGFMVPPAEFLPLLQDICRRHGILLIADEVQTGFGRTGRWFACERYQVEPELAGHSQIAGRRFAACSRDRSCRNYGRPNGGRAGRNVWRKPALVRSCPGSAGNPRNPRAAGSGRRLGSAVYLARPGLAKAMATRWRRAGLGSNASDRISALVGDTRTRTRGNQADRTILL